MSGGVGRDRISDTEEALRQNIQGEVRFDSGSRALYATDGSNYRQKPIGVVIPRTRADVIETVRICHENQVPLLPRGCGTSLAGQCCNVAVVLDYSKYLNGILKIDPVQRLARVEPGLILDHLKEAVGPDGLTFGPDPATHSHCTLGGMIGNNSCGVHSVLAEKIGPGPMTSHNVHSLEILTHDGLQMEVGETSEEDLEAIIREGGRRGEIYSGLKRIRDQYEDLIRKRFPKIPRRASGYNLDQLLPENGFHVARALVGSEGTCVNVLEATLHLIPEPKKSILLVIGYPDVFTSGDDIPLIREFDIMGLEGMDEKLIEMLCARGLHPDYVKELPEGHGWLLVEFGGDTEEEAKRKARGLMVRLEATTLQAGRQKLKMKIFPKESSQDHIWKVRESGLAATARVPGKHDTWPGWEDSSVPPERVGEYLRSLKNLFTKYDYEASVYGHFGQGCIHCRIPFALESEEGQMKARAFLEEATDLVLSIGGSLSGEHGDGQARGELLEKMYGPELMQAFREFKSLWDPNWRMNPGKVIDANPIMEDIRIALPKKPAPIRTHFRYQEDGGSFSRAALRCVGVGECRRTEKGTMCPSFMVTREEKHSTRGRAHLLYEMTLDNSGIDLWQSEEVKEALDLCLACKGCKSDCPMSVDVATYKAEFLSHYYEKNRRPINAYAMGWIDRWARLAAWMPSVVNFASQAPLLRSVAKFLGGITPERPLPAFADQTFKAWFFKREVTSRKGQPVILWPDTFNNHFHPQTAKAAVEVLEAAGYDVIVPKAALCCGRPLYDFGMLDLAKKRLQDIIEHLREPIRAGIPMVGLEPSCIAIFRDELMNLFPDDEDACRLSKQTFTLAELFSRDSEKEGLSELISKVTQGKLQRKALIHGHCHHKSVMGFDESERLYRRLGLDLKILDSGCCGMAGSFGFERGKYDISVQIGERVLLPAVREASNDTLILADGFSCRTQIDHLTDRRAIHLAEILQAAIQPQMQLPEARPERAFPIPAASPWKGAAIIAGVSIAGYFLTRAIRSRLPRRATRWLGSRVKETPDEEKPAVSDPLSYSRGESGKSRLPPESPSLGRNGSMEPDHPRSV